MYSLRPSSSRYALNGFVFLLSCVIALFCGFVLATVGGRWLFGGTWIATLHDRALLPVLVEKILVDSKWLIRFLTIFVVIALLWPHRTWHIPLVAFASGTLLVWMLAYEMWYHLPVCFAVIALVLLYATVRFYWPVVIRLFPLVGRRAFVSLERVAEARYLPSRRHEVNNSESSERAREQSRPLLELYYDAIRATTMPHKTNGDSSVELWDRSAIEPAQTLGLWGIMFTQLARWYRRRRAAVSLPHRMWLSLCLSIPRLVVGERRPGSLATEWLDQILTADEQRLFAQLLEAPSDFESWLELFHRWASSVELLIEYRLFDLSQMTAESEAIAWGAEKFDEISRMGLVAQVAAA